MTWRSYASTTGNRLILQQPEQDADEEFAELVEEVRHLGRLPKPVVVRNRYAPGEYQIVDGEHGWRPKRSGCRR
jgi:ParB-like chromosome segregation protein Spo0J